MFSRGTFRGRRSNPASSSASNIHREDQQPNEEINKRQRAGPPSVVRTVVPLPGRGNWNSPRGTNRGHKPRGGWTQHAARGSGNRSWRASHSHHVEHGRDHWFRQTAPFYQRHSSTSTDQSWHTPSPSWKNSQPEPSASAHNQEPRINRSFVGASLPSSGAPSTSTLVRDYSQTPRLLNHQSTSFHDQLPQPIGNTGMPLSLDTSVAHMPTTNLSTLPSNSPWPHSEDMLPRKRRRLDCAPSPSESATKLEEPAHLEIASILPPSVVRVKPEERSPSPLVSSRRLVTQSCNFYPLPTNCRKIDPDTQVFNPDHVRNRNALCAKERAILKGRGLTTTNVLFRDDGMVIEWKSPVAVWSDTLLPEPSIPRPVLILKERPAESNGPLPLLKSPSQRSCSPEVIEIDGPFSPKPKSKAQQEKIKDLSSKKKHIPLPGRLGWRRPETAHTTTTAITITPPPPPSQTADIELSQSLTKAKASELPQPSPAPPRPRPLPLPKPRRKEPVVSAEASIRATSSQRENISTSSPTQPFAQDIVETPQPSQSENARVLSPDVWSAEDLVDVEPLAVDYLQRYIKSFDADLSILRAAYALNATFSLHMPAPPLPPSSSSPPQRDALLQGSEVIVSELTRNLEMYKFCPVGIVHTVRLHYDVVSLCPAAGGGVLLLVHGEIVDMSLERLEVRGLEMRFVLRRIQGDGANGEKARWPLVAVSQQIAIRGKEKKLVGAGPVAGLS